MDSVKLEQALLASWSAETSASPEEWAAENPALGQCAVTACLVQDYEASDIVNCIVETPDGEKVSHYFNLIDGEPLDMTRRQFPEGSRFGEAGPKTGNFATTREYVLSYDATRERYDILRDRVGEFLARQAMSA